MTRVTDRRPSGAPGSSRWWYWVPAAAAAAALLAGANPAAAAPAAPAATAGASWGRTVEVPGLAALNAGGNAQVLSVSCWRAGYCAAGGFYTRKLGSRQAFVVLEHAGRWAKAAEVPGSGALNAGGNAQVTSLSCVSGGVCLAGGYYAGHGKTTQGFVVTERGGRWSAARPVPGLAALTPSGQDAQVEIVSCAPGYCAAGGFFGGEGFVVTERAGRWGSAQVPPGLAALNTGQAAAVTSVSCPSAGNCAAGGYYQTDVMDPDDTLPVEAFVVNHASGKWGQAEEVPGSDGLNGGWDASVLSVSCSSAGNCGLGGYLQPVEFMDCDPPAGDPPPLNCEGSFVANARNGHWGGAQYVTYPGMNQVNSVSCTAAGDCSAGGIGSNPLQESPQAWAVTERGGRWGVPEQLPGIAQLLRSVKATESAVVSVLCWSPGNCGAVGFYYSVNSGHGHVFVVSQRSGRWGTAEQAPGTAALNLGKLAGVTSVSCTRPRACVAGGYYTDRSGRKQAFVGGATK
jgi:hypothetical protein